MIFLISTPHKVLGNDCMNIDNLICKKCWMSTILNFTTNRYNLAKKFYLIKSQSLFFQIVLFVKSEIFILATCIKITKTNQVCNISMLWSCLIKSSSLFLEKSPQHLTPVLDMWTDRFRKWCYINICVHSCHVFELKVVSPTTEYFPKPQNNKAITEKLILWKSFLLKRISQLSQMVALILWQALENKV